MYSKTACQFYKWITNLSFKIFVIPYYIENGNEGVTDVKVVYGNQTNVFFWKFTSWANILAKIVLISCGIHLEIAHPASRELKMSESAQFYFIASIFSLFLAFRICNILFIQTTVQLQNAFFTFNTKLTKLHKINPNEKDGTELFTAILILFGFGAVFVSIPAAIGFIHFEIHFAEYFKTNYLSITIILGILLGYSIFADFLVVFQYVDATLAYCNFTYKCLNLLRWKEGISNKKVRKFLRIYCGHQVFHNSAMSDCSTLVAIILGIACITLIAIFYTIIGHYNRINAPIGFAAASVGFIIVIFVRICLNVATSISDSSRSFLNSFLRNDFALSKFTRKSLIASKILYVKIGDFDIVTRRTFPDLMSNFVVARVTDLLLMQA